ncbi:MAG: hypothetical protein A2Y33_04725 [Spirochaetes bacterium GWF1_51_8]|nr:MAG: hypothetical protein A2Y33_04725 [Spirochaetes bacterium GWF1_51_8]
MSLFTKIFELVFGTKQQRDVKKLLPLVEKINEFEPAISALNNDELRNKTREFKELLAGGKTLDDILPEAFAVVREVSQRTLKMRHFDVQMMGGVVLHRGVISEMKTGEGKTLVATLAIYLNALSGLGVHLVTVNDYLAKRDAQWMAPIYRFLELTVGIINHEKSYRVEWEDVTQYKMMTVECTRKQAYECDITYGTNNEFGFDYLRDNMVFQPQQKVQRKHNYAIVDEVDSILIDEARTPLIISGPSDEATDLYYKVDKIVPRLTEAEINEKKEPIEGTGDYVVDEKDKTVVVTEMGLQKAEKLLGITDIFSPKNSKLVHHLNQAVRAHKLYQNDVEYVVENGEVVIVDEFTGRKMPGRRWSDGLHQAIEAKERLEIKREFQTLATITFQNYFRMYTKLAGMTGTAETEATEFYSIYKLDVSVIPTNVNVTRLDGADKIYINEKAKFNAIVRDIEERHKKGQPILVGTVSVEKSEKLSMFLKRKNIRHNILNAKYHEREADIIKDAGLPGAVTIATNMAGRGTDIKLGAGVVEVGGLTVIGSERHEARRIDNQLRGRSGRQGDPGESQFYVSLEDDLMRLFGMDRQIGLMTRFGFSEEEEIQSKMISRAIERAQKRVENRNFEIRKNLLEYDNVMNEQRTYIYGIRDRILDIHNNLGIIDEIIDDVVESFVSTASNPNHPDTWDMDELGRWFRVNFYHDPNLNLSDMTGDEAREMLHKTIKGMTWERLEGIPDNIRAEGFKYVMLNTLDTKWKEHLRNIDALQEGIGLTGYAQKNPIVEYKVESSHMFLEMRERFKNEGMSLMSRLQIQSNFETKEDDFEAIPTRTQTVHSEYGQFDSVSSGSASQQNAAAAMGHSKPAPVRKTEKPGRNEPCWCGSGKKYKHCHMDEDLRKERVGRVAPPQ